MNDDATRAAALVDQMNDWLAGEEPAQSELIEWCRWARDLLARWPE